MKIVCTCAFSRIVDDQSTPTLVVGHRQVTTHPVHLGRPLHPHRHRRWWPIASAPWRPAIFDWSTMVSCSVRADERWLRTAHRFVAAERMRRSSCDDGILGVGVVRRWAAPNSLWQHDWLERRKKVDYFVFL